MVADSTHVVNSSHEVSAARWKRDRNVHIVQARSLRLWRSVRGRSGQDHNTGSIRQFELSPPKAFVPWTTVIGGTDK